MLQEIFIFRGKKKEPQLSMLIIGWKQGTIFRWIYTWKN